MQMYIHTHIDIHIHLSTTTRQNYRLGAVINHNGCDTNVGHYTSYCRDSKGVWLLFNDTEVPIYVIHMIYYTLYYDLV